MITSYVRNELFNEELKEEVETIKRYLETIDTWGHFELTIFSNCLFIFDNQYIIHSFKNSISKMKAYVDATYYSELLSNFILNGLRLSFNRQSVTLRKLFLTELKKITIHHKQSLAAAHYKAFSALDLLAEGNESAISEIDQSIAFFEWLELTSTKEYYLKLKNTII